MAGIWNQTIVQLVEENANGVFPANYINKFINFHDILIESGAYYLFEIINTDRAEKKVAFLWSFLDLHPKKEVFFFESLGFTGFKEFIMNDY